MKHLDSQPHDLQPYRSAWIAATSCLWAARPRAKGVPRGAGDLFHSQFQGSVEPASEVDSRRARVAD